MTLLAQLATGKPMAFGGGKVKVTYAPNGYHIHTERKHGDFNDDLKTQLPWYARRWDSEARAWWVKEVYLVPFVLDIIASWFDPALAAELEAARAKALPVIELIAELEDWNNGTK